MPRDSAHTFQLPLFVSDPAASPEALARYEAIRPVLTGQRSLPNRVNRPGTTTGDCGGFSDTFGATAFWACSIGAPCVTLGGGRRWRPSYPDIFSSTSSGWPSRIPSPRGNWRGSSATATTMPWITGGSSACSRSITSPLRPCGCITTVRNRRPHSLAAWGATRSPLRARHPCAALGTGPGA
jgi:hypothetical protein